MYPFFRQGTEKPLDLPSLECFSIHLGLKFIEQQAFSASRLGHFGASLMRSLHSVITHLISTIRCSLIEQQSASNS